jgi:hypothetical protein
MASPTPARPEDVRQGPGEEGGECAARHEEGEGEDEEVHQELVPVAFAAFQVELDERRAAQAQGVLTQPFQPPGDEGVGRVELEEAAPGIPEVPGHGALHAAGIQAAHAPVVTVVVVPARSSRPGRPGRSARRRGQGGDGHGAGRFRVEDPQGANGLGHTPPVVALAFLA